MKTMTSAPARLSGWMLPQNGEHSVVEAATSMFKRMQFYQLQLWSIRGSEVFLVCMATVDTALQCPIGENTDKRTTDYSNTFVLQYL